MSVRYMGCPTCGQPWPTEPGEVQVTDAMVAAARAALPPWIVSELDTQRQSCGQLVRDAITAALKAQEGASDE